MINYPNKKKVNINSKNIQNVKVQHANRGMKFEQLINESNEYYAANDKGYIYKKPTPIKVVRVQTINNNFSRKHQIKEAYYEQASTTDYNGIYRGRYIDFEAKEVRYKTFNIGANLKKHQINHLINVARHGAIAFLLVYFTSVDQVYILEAEKLAFFLETNKTKSIIPLSFFVDNGYIVNQGFLPKIDYLKVVDKLIEDRGE